MGKLKISTKIGIGSGATFLIIIIFGYILLPIMVKHQIKSQGSIKPGNEARDRFTKMPFPLDFKIYIFNVTNPLDVVNGDSPVLDEIGPYYFELRILKCVGHVTATIERLYCMFLFLVSISLPFVVVTQYRPDIREVGGLRGGFITISVERMNHSTIMGARESKEKVNLVDNEDEDELTYNEKVTWIFKSELSGPGLTGEEVVTIGHPLMITLAVIVSRDKPSMLTLVNKAINAIFQNPKTPFLTAPAMDILFRGVLINCDVSDFAGKAVCGQLRTDAKDLQHISDTMFKFSFFGKRNASISEHTFTVRRGVKQSHDVGLVVAYDGAKEMSIWPDKECNQYLGTDSTIFPPFMDKEDGVPVFVADICRSVVAKFDGETEYRGITVNKYSATFGDMSSDKSLQCFCPANASCWKQGLHDLTKCLGAPLVASQPHFYDSDMSYLQGVRGLHPVKEDHGISSIFEVMTGTPIAGSRRLQFNIPFIPMEKVSIMKNVPNTVVPLIWVDEGFILPDNLADLLVGAFRMFKIIQIIKAIILSLSIVGLGAAIFLHYKNTDRVSITKAVKPVVKENYPEKNVQNNGSPISRDIGRF